MAEEEPVVAEADLTDAALKDLAAAQQADDAKTAAPADAAKPAAQPAQQQTEWSYVPGDRVLVRSMRNGGPHSATIETP